MVFFLLISFLMNKVYSSGDPLTSALSFVLLVGLTSLQLSVSFPFWVPYVLSLLYLSGVLAVLVFMSTMCKVILFKSGFSVLLIFLFGSSWLISPSSLSSFFIFYTLVNIFYFMLMWASVYVFLGGAHLLLYRKGAMRLLSCVFSLVSKTTVFKTGEKVCFFLFSHI